MYVSDSKAAETFIGKVTLDYFKDKHRKIRG